MAEKILDEYNKKKVRELEKRTSRGYMWFTVFALITVFCILAMNLLQGTFIITGFISLIFLIDTWWCTEEIKCIEERRPGNFYHH